LGHQPLQNIHRTDTDDPETANSGQRVTAASASPARSALIEVVTDAEAITHTATLTELRG
tara:strand:- start:67 stop:246 length:180 start_codon:yes stop_codon:yes gene_type:complete